MSTLCSQDRFLSDVFRCFLSRPVYVRADPNARTSVRPGQSSHAPNTHEQMRRLPEQNGLYINYFGKKSMWVQEHGLACVPADGACVAPQGQSPPYTPPPAPH